MRRFPKRQPAAEEQHDASLGHGNKSVNSFSKCRLVYRPDNGLLYHAIKLLQMTRNDTQALPPMGRLDCAMDTFANMQSIIRHVLQTKTGSNYDRTLEEHKTNMHSDNENTT